MIYHIILLLFKLMQKKPKVKIIIKTKLVKQKVNIPFIKFYPL